MILHRLGEISGVTAGAGSVCARESLDDGKKAETDARALKSRGVKDTPLKITRNNVQVIGEPAPSTIGNPVKCNDSKNMYLRFYRRDQTTLAPVVKLTQDGKATSFDFLALNSKDAVGIRAISGSRGDANSGPAGNCTRCRSGPFETGVSPCFALQLVAILLESYFDKLSAGSNS